jgi:hypothetical protein
MHWQARGSSRPLSSAPHCDDGDGARSRSARDDQRRAPHCLTTIVLAELTDFVTRHRAHGKLTGDATEPEANDYMLTVTCPCGVTFMRWVTPGDATRGLVLSDLLASGVSFAKTSSESV